MRRKDREVLDPRWLEATLDAASVLRLGLWDGEEPYVVPLNFVRQGKALFFHCAPSGRKLDILKTHPRVCFEATSAAEIALEGPGPCDITTRYASVIGWGDASLVEDRQAKASVLAALNRKFGAADGPFPDGQLARTCVVRIDIDRMTGKTNLEGEGGVEAL